MEARSVANEQAPQAARVWGDDVLEYMRRYEAVMGFERDERGMQRPLSMADRERHIREVLEDYIAAHPAESDRIASEHRRGVSAASSASGARVLIRLPRSLHEELKACAGREGMSVNSVLIAAVTAWVTRQAASTG